MMADEVCHRRRRQLTAIRGQERPWRSRRQGDSKRYYVISFCFASMLEYGSKDRLSGMPFVSLLVYDLYRLRHFNAFLVHLLKQEESSGFSLKLPRIISQGNDQESPMDMKVLSTYVAKFVLEGLKGKPQIDRSK